MTDHLTSMIQRIIFFISLSVSIHFSANKIIDNQEIIIELLRQGAKL